MSGSNVGRPPRSDAEWARDIQKRVRSLEQSRVARVGAWTLIEREGGLFAVKPPGVLISLDNPSAAAEFAAQAGTAVDQTARDTANEALNNWATSIDSLVGSGHSFTDLVTWWQDTFDTAGTASSTAADAAQAAADARAQADEARAQADEAMDNWATAMDNALGPGAHSVADLVDYWQSTADTATEAQDNWTALLTGLAQGDPDALATYLANSKATADAAAANFTSMVNALFTGGTVGTAIKASAVPTLDASKIVTGLLALGILPQNIPQSYIAGLTAALNSFITTGNFNPLLALLFGSGTTAVPSGATTITAPAVPLIDASKVATGTLLVGLMPTGIPPAKVGSALSGANINDDLTTLVNSLFGETAINTITTAAADIANYLSNAISGGSAPTSTNSPVAFLENIIGPNSIPHGNITIPQSPGSGSITHDASYHLTPISTFVTTLNGTYNHTCAAGANYLVARIGWYSSGNAASTTAAITYRGVSLQPIAVDYYFDGVSNTFAGIFALLMPATGGAYPVGITVNAPYGDVGVLFCETDSYIGVGQVGAIVTNTGSISNPSVTIPSDVGDYIVQSFICVDTNDSNETLTGYTQNGVAATPVYNSGTKVWGAANNSAVLLAGDAPGAASVNFGAIPFYAGPKEFWVGCAANLIPLPADRIGSGFRVRNISTSSVTATSGNQLFGNGFFSSVEARTDDGTYTTTGNTYTVGHAGWYNVTISVALVAGFVNQWIGLNLIQNAGSPKRGDTKWIGGSSANTVLSHTFQVYCDALDTLKPGYYSSVTASAFTGSTDGLSTYFEVSLGNRGLHS